MKRTACSFLAFPVLTIAAIFFSALNPSLTRADIIYSGVNFNVEFSTPSNVGNTPLKTTTLTVIGKNGYKPNGFDSVVNAGTGITTATDNLHQIYQLGVLETPTLTLNQSLPSIPLELDTHFLITAGTYLPMTAPSENRLTFSTTEHAYGGFGKQLVGAFTMTGTPNDTWNLAQLVAKDGTTVNLKFVVSGVKGGVSTFSETVQGSFTVAVPEPNVLVLFATGLLSAGIFGLRTHRRRSAR